MTLDTLPLWLQIPLAALLVVGGLFALIGAVGMLRFPDFYMRLHAPTKASTDEPSNTSGHGQLWPRARKPCGMAVPSVSMPTSQPSAAAGLLPTRCTSIFMPSG